MNWRRGLFRFWAIASVIWVLAVVVVTYREETAWAEFRPAPPAGFVWDSQLHSPYFWVGQVFGPPAIAGVALLLLSWVIAGFRPPQSD